MAWYDSKWKCRSKVLFNEIGEIYNIEWTRSQYRKSFSIFIIPFSLSFWAHECALLSISRTWKILKSIYMENTTVILVAIQHLPHWTNGYSTYTMFSSVLNMMSCWCFDEQKANIVNIGDMKFWTRWRIRGFSMIWNHYALKVEFFLCCRYRNHSKIYCKKNQISKNAIRKCLTILYVFLTSVPFGGGWGFNIWMLMNYWKLSCVSVEVL